MLLNCFGMRLFFLTIPKPLRQYTLWKKTLSIPLVYKKYRFVFLLNPTGSLLPNTLKPWTKSANLYPPLPFHIHTTAWKYDCDTAPLNHRKSAFTNSRQCPWTKNRTLFCKKPGFTHCRSFFLSKLNRRNTIQWYVCGRIAPVLNKIVKTHKEKPMKACSHNYVHGYSEIASFNLVLNVIDNPVWSS